MCWCDRRGAGQTEREPPDQSSCWAQYESIANNYTLDSILVDCVSHELPALNLQTSARIQIASPTDVSLTERCSSPNALMSEWIRAAQHQSRAAALDIVHIPARISLQKWLH